MVSQTNTHEDTFTHDELNTFLKEYKIFPELDEDVITNLLSENFFGKKEYKGKKENETTDNLIIKQKDEVDKRIFIIYSGKVQISIKSEENDKTFNLMTLEEGELFGEMALLDEEPRSVTVEAITDCILVVIEGERFRDLINQYPRMKLQILSKLSQKVRKTNKKIIGVQSFDIDSKIDNYILKFNAELNAIQAATEASLTVFEQVNIRATEIINNTERNHQNTIYFVRFIGSILSIIVLVFGFFGFTEYNKIKSDIDGYIKNIKKDKEEISQIKSIVEKDASIARKNANKIKEITEKIDSTVKYFPALQNSVGENISHQFKNSLESDKNKAKALYQMLPERDIPKALNMIEERIALEGDNIFQDYTDLLLESLQHTSFASNKVRVYYLLLSNAVLINKKTFKDGSTFEKVLSDFEKYIQENKNKKITLDISYIERIFTSRSDEEKVSFKRIKELIPEP